MCRLMKSGLLFLGALFFLGEIWGIPFRKLRVEEGLSHNMVHCVMQDRLGFIWIGTADGLNCYDGSSNKIFRNWSEDMYSLANNYVTALLDANDSLVWVGTNKGLYIYERDKGKFSRMDLQTSYGVSVSSEIRRMLVGQDGTVWIATLGQGIFRYDGHQLQQFISATSFASDLAMDEYGHIYVATLRNDILILDKRGNFLNRIQTEKTTYSLYYDKKYLWVGMEKGTIGCFETNGRLLISYSIGNEHSNTVRCMVTDKAGGLFVGTDYGLYRVNDLDRRIERIDNSYEINGLSNSQVTSLAEDAEGGIWVATNGGGINYMSSYAILFDNYSFSREDLGFSGVRRNVGPICGDEKGNIYVGTNQGVFFLEKDKQSFLRNFLPDAVSKEIGDVRALWLDKSSLWIGTYGDGMFRVNLSDYSVKTYRYESGKANSLSSNYILDIYRDNDNVLYIGMNNGLCWLDERTDKFLPVTSIGAMVPVTDIYEDHFRNLWIATSANGIYRCDKKTGVWRHYQYESRHSGALFNNNVTVLQEDQDGHLWVGTNGGGLGYFQFNTETFVEYDSEGQILPSKVIYAIEQDREGGLWISTNKGLVRLNEKSKKKFQLFTSNNGLQSSQFNLHSSLLKKNGTLVFGSMNGLNIFVPSRLKPNQFVPPVYITSISFPYEKNMAMKENLTWDYLQKLPDEIVLPYSHNSFTLNFAALSYEDPTKNQYRCYMEGENKEWTRASLSNKASYTNLSPGTYHFQVMGTNNDGVWNERVASVTIVITPPWWLTIGAKVIYVFLALFFLILAGWLWNRFVKRKYRRRMEEYNVMREKEMYQQKISFFVNLVHEIRTPLSLIRLPLEQMIEADLSVEKRSEMLEIINRNVNYLLGITNQLLDFQKIENGGLTLNKENCNVTQLAKDVYEQFVPSAGVKHVLLEDALPEAALYTYIDRDKVSKIMVNILGNALKYTRTRILVSMEYNETELHWYVEDDGEGIATADKDKIFEVFYRVHEENSAPSGTGIGLAYARSLAEKHGGHLEVEKSRWGGARFELSLPIELVSKAEQENAVEGLRSCDGEEEPDMTINKNLVVLLVEDNSELLRTVSKILGKWYCVKKAQNGEQGLKVLETESVDVIVSDVMMPVMDGMEFCRRVKQNVDTSHVPFILLTAKATLESKTEGMLCGADAYVDKPFSIHQLRAQIENLLRLRQLFHRQMTSVEADFTVSHPNNELGLSQKDIEFAAQLQAAIGKQLSDENFSIDMIAEELGMSRSSFYRKIKALFGMTPNEYLKVVRLNKAAELIMTGSRVTEIYLQVGFSSPSYFTKCFKVHFGVLPKDYAANKKNK